MGSSINPSSRVWRPSSTTSERALSLPRLTLIASSHAVAAETKTVFLGVAMIEVAHFESLVGSPNHQKSVWGIEQDVHSTFLIEHLFKAKLRKLAIGERIKRTRHIRDLP